MNVNDSDCGRDIAELVRLLPVPAERDFPAGRQQIIKEHLLGELHASRNPARGRGRKSRPGRGALVTVAAAGVIAVAAAIVVGQSQPAHLTAKADSPNPPGIASPAPAVSAAQLVAYAARAAAAAPALRPGPHQWIYFKRLLAGSSAGAGGMLQGPPNERVMTQIWIRVDGRQLASFSRGKLVVVRWNGQDATPGGWPSASYQYLGSLPADPARLKAVIAANLKAQNFVAGQGNQGIFSAIEDLMDNVVLPPRLRASLYGILAALPGVHFDRSVTDIAGRHGLGLYVIQGYLKDEIVINPKTYGYMGDQTVAVKAHTTTGTDGTLHVRKGQILGWTAVLSSGIVQHPGQIP